MPAICIFMNMWIMMHWDEGCHKRPHFHVNAGGDMGVFDIETCEMIKGDLRRRQINLITGWAELYKIELMENWSLARQGKPLKKIGGLAKIYKEGEAEDGLECH